MMRHLAVVLLGFSTWCLAAEDRRFEHPNDRFAITLSTGWNEVDVKTAPYAKHVLESDSDVVAHAYQLASETNFKAVIFVEMDESWRIPERELALMQIPGLRQKFIGESLEVLGLRVLDSSFDTNRLAMRVSATADYAKSGKVRTLIGWYFTDKGSYSVTCVAPVEHFKTVSPQFTKALDTFHFDPALAYRVRPDSERHTSDGRTKVVKFRFGWVFGVVALAMLLCRRMFRGGDEG